MIIRHHLHGAALDTRWTQGLVGRHIPSRRQESEFCRKNYTRLEESGVGVQIIQPPPSPNAVKQGQLDGEYKGRGRSRQTNSIRHCAAPINLRFRALEGGIATSSYDGRFIIPPHSKAASALINIRVNRLRFSPIRSTDTSRRLPLCRRLIAFTAVPCAILAAHSQSAR